MKILRWLLIVATSMSAQQRSLQVSEPSSAKVYLGTPENPTSFDVGVAKVTGEMQLGSDDKSASRFNLTIYSADHKYQKIYGEQSVITFQSESVEQRTDGKLEVQGRLTVTQVFGEEGANHDPGTSGYPKQLRTSQEAIFVFDGLEQPASASDRNSGGAVPVRKNGSDPGIVVTGSASVNGETFPQLLLTIQDVAWPLLADDDSYATHATTSENYYEATCRGAISSMPSTQLGKDDGNNQQSPPAGNLVTIQLKLILVRADSDSAYRLLHTDTVR